MTWRISDIFFLIITATFSLNILIILIVIFRRYLEKKLDMQYLSRLLKIIILYVLIPMPGIICGALYAATFHGLLKVQSDDISLFYVIGKKTISTSTEGGNHWLFALMIIVWVLGIICFGLMRYIINMLSLHKLKKYSVVSQEKSLFDLQVRIMEELQLKRHVTILKNDLVSSPFTLGVFRIKIFLPSMYFSDSEMAFILRHELIHCKNDDYIYRRLVFFLCSLYWFNPAVYLLANFFVDVNEMACDDIVLDKKSSNEKSTYAKLIVNIAESGLPLTGAVGFTDLTKNNLERRINNIMKKTQKSTKLSFLILAAIVVFACPFSALAASVGVSEFQNTLSEKMEVSHSLELSAQNNDIYIEYVEKNSNKNLNAVMMEVEARGATSIDYDIKGRERMVSDSVSLPMNSEVVFYIKGDNNNDRFKAGLIDSNGNIKYVSASNGKINYTFTVQKAGEYDLFIEGLTNSNIHVAGSITILQ